LPILCFFWLNDFEEIDDVLAAIASTFSFTLAEIKALDLSYERLDGAFYWNQIAEAIAEKIKQAGQEGK
jgi:hypothetical protein